MPFSVCEARGRHGGPVLLGCRIVADTLAKPTPTQQNVRGNTGTRTVI